MTSQSVGQRRLVLTAFVLSGAAALVYEVTWTRALSLLLGSTTHAVSTMLATFMLGLALGAALGGRLADRSPRLLFHFGLCELGIGLTGLVSVPLAYSLPGVYLAIYRATHVNAPVFFALQVLLCALVMLVPTILMGATFPLVSRLVTGGLEEMGQRVGSAYSWNTVGAVFGSLAAGFFLIPTFGIRGAALTAGLVNLAVGLTLVLRSRRAPPLLLGALLLLYVPAGLSTWAAEREPTLFSFYNAHRHLDGVPWAAIVGSDRAQFDLLDETSPPEGQVSAFRSRDGRLVLQVGGKIEGTATIDLANTRLLALLPAAAHPQPARGLIIGLGAGATLEAAKEVVERVELVEINPGVVDAVARFGPPGVLDGVEIIRNDARNHLLCTETRYDVISSEPSYPTDPVVANLFTREYFELVATRLAAGGVYCHWMPYHLLADEDVTMMVKTFGTVFPHSLLWKVPESQDLLLLGGRSAFALTPDEIRRRVAELDSTGAELHYVLSRDAGQIAAIVQRPDVPLNTDDHPLLEFRVAAHLRRGGPEARPGAP